ncbi:hypothetical protein JYU10_00440 [bacterium AH-315-J04]|nr:hypothetical protein [bacterium AH-315-J04]
MKAIDIVGILLLLCTISSCRTPSSNNTPDQTETCQAKPLNAFPGLHNVFHVNKNLISGGEPQGDKGFESLANLQVRTIISVDGARPDIERAKAHHMRYVHIPLGYKSIDNNSQRLLAKAIRDLPANVYVHCLHGKHRGPAAVAIASVMLGRMDRNEAVTFMRKAGTSPMYDGLFSCVMNASPLDQKVLDRTPSNFPKVTRVTGLVETMADMGRVYNDLKLIRDAGWITPANHPDLIPSRKASYLASLLQHLQADPDTRSKPEEFHSLLKKGTQRADEFSQALAHPPTHDPLQRFNSLAESCQDCHTKYRN